MSPNQISPSTPFVVSFYIPVNTDSNTYYVRAVIYDALTGEILATENLTRQTTNTRLYSKQVQSPGDSSSLGRRIIVVATAYTDSGYTTKSADYQDQAEVFLVKTQPTLLGGGGYGVDYVKVREIVENVFDIREKMHEDRLKKAKEDEKPIEAPKMQWDAVLGAIGVLQREINRIPKDQTNLEPIVDGMGKLQKLINEKEVTPKTDLVPVMDKIDDLETRIEASEIENKENLKEAVNLLKKQFTELIPKLIKETIQKSKFVLDVSTVKATIEPIEEKTEEEVSQKSPFNVEEFLTQ